MITSKIKKRLFWFLLIGGFVALGSVMLRPLPLSGPISKRAPNITLPDALIRSHSLSKFPPDLLRIPLAREVLAEEFVTYYEQNESRMALSGTLRRIAYEHRLDFPERLLESVLDEPAEVALWRDDAGRLKDFVIVLSRNYLARIIQTLLPAVAKTSDMQLSSAGKLDGSDVDILVLEYGAKRHLLLLSKGDRIVALSNPGMLFTNGESQSEKAAETLRELLGGGKTASPFARHFLLEKPLPEKKHELTLGTRAFALNYESFVPGLAALGLTFDDQGKWQSAALLDGAAWHADSSRNLWAALPHGPGFCAALPVDWAQMASLLKELETHFHRKRPTDLKEFTARFTGSAAVCWYKGSRLYTPLFAAHLNAGADEKKVQEFFNLAAFAINAKEGKTSMDAKNGSALWQAEIASRFGSSRGDGTRSLKPTLAIQRDIVFFSPDAVLVENALAVAAKRYPALSDGFHAEKDVPLAFIDPGELASLLRNEAFIALPRDEEALFRNAAEAYLVPRLEALARYPAQHVGLPKTEYHDGLAWYPLKWQEGAVR
ncbi:MAG: DUF2138 family protein [Azoarcus sp.]|jgi:uncharacterized protein YfaA (DUF2138 family)|nr:DUF2138 family protein [Azoarcus sp.]